MAHAINWFEIPTADFARAVAFYERVLGTTLVPMDGTGEEMAAFPADWSRGETGGALVRRAHFEPSATGTMVYLAGGEDLAPMLGRVEAAGGTILLPKTKIAMEGAGHLAVFRDTEGNTVGLHSPS